MANPSGNNLDLTPAAGDPGDETARRYRYQWTCAAIFCCRLLDGTYNNTEVFCEHHEDILLKHSDGTFTCIQIKTRASDQSVWKASDKSIVTSCSRFVKLNKSYTNSIRGFRFLTNHPFHSTKNATSFTHILSIIKGTLDIAELDKQTLKFLDIIADESGCSREDCYAALKKTVASDNLPKLVDIEIRLVQSLTDTWDPAKNCSYHLIRQAAQTLVYECERASSLAHEESLPAYYIAADDTTDIEILARIEGKRLTLKKVLEILNTGLNATALLDGNPDSNLGPGQGVTSLLFKKLDAGGFSAVSCNSAEDLRDKSDYLGIVWTKKHGRERGLQQYSHVRSIVLSDAARAFESTKTADSRFGPLMLNDLRSRFLRRRQDKTQVFDCSDEHLEGFAYSLTSQCKVQWSLDRPWEED